MGCNLGKAVMLIAPAIVGERTAGPGGALTVRTSHRQNGKRFRFVIARSEATWQSRRTEPDPRKTIGEIVTAFPRLPRARSALAMTDLIASRRRMRAAKIANLQGAHNPQGARRIRKAAKPPTAAQ